jgi:hypothetical protein
MQVKLSRHVAQLTALGCPCFPPAPQLGDALGEMLANSVALTPADAKFQLTADEKALLREAHQQIAALAQQLAHAPVPLSLDHGDLWSAQILQRSGHPVLIDWSDVNVTLPFVSLCKYLLPQEVEPVFPDSPAAADILRDAYLYSTGKSGCLISARSVYCRRIIMNRRDLEELTKQSFCRLLAANKMVSSIELFLEIGKLSKANVEEWRFRRLPYLSCAFPNSGIPIPSNFGQHTLSVHRCSAR